MPPARLPTTSTSGASVKLVARRVMCRDRAFRVRRVRSSTSMRWSVLPSGKEPVCVKPINAMHGVSAPAVATGRTVALHVHVHVARPIVLLFTLRDLFTALSSAFSAACACTVTVSAGLTGDGRTAVSSVRSRIWRAPLTSTRAWPRRAPPTSGRSRRGGR